MKTTESSRAARLFGMSLVKSGEQVVGNLCRGEDGKYRACDDAPAVSGSELTMTGPKPGGTLPGGVYSDEKSGRSFVVKFYPKPAQAAVEAAANMIYQSVGLRAPNSVTVDGVKHQGADKFGVASEFIPGFKDGSESSITASSVKKDLQRGFAVDALLANWDVIGMGWDNVGFGKDGKPIRADNGGSMMFRAQGKEKKFPGDRVDELQTFMDPSVNPKAAAVFGSLAGDDEARLKALELAGSIPDQVFEHAVQSAGFDGAGWSKKEKADLVETLKGRRDVIKAEAEKLRAEMSAPPPTKGEGSAVAKEVLKAQLKRAPAIVDATLKQLGYDAGKMNYFQRKDAAQRATLAMLPNSKQKFTIPYSYGKLETTQEKLVEAIRADWSGDSNSKHAQWFRQVAAEYYGRDLKDEFLGGEGEMFMSKIPPEVREAVMAIKAVSEAMVMMKFGINDRMKTITLWRGLKGTYGAKLNKIAKNLKPGGKMGVSMSALSSTSLSSEKARAFAGYQGVVISDQIKVKHVWGFGGYGFESEEEVVIGKKTPHAWISKEEVLQKALLDRLIRKQVEGEPLVLVLREENEMEFMVLPPGSFIFNLDDHPDSVWPSHKASREV